ncbi:hypothetical protein ACIOG4_27925 [Streptomyces microflavus]|uniref:hypothetical protein n=1 Tax=Streptomyces microflavus TaxID=1919 RepID=UPI003819E68D
MGLLTTFVVTAPAAAADDTDKYKPGGVGDLMPSPITPKGQGTLFEMYTPSAYQLDKQLSSDLTGGDLIDGGMHEVASMLMGVLSMVGRAAVTITQWCFNVITLPEVEPAIARAIGAAATPMATNFLPSAVAVGMFIAWARRSDQSMFGQLAWVAASAAIACTFFTSPQTWVKGVDETRQAGASVAMTTIDGGLGGNTSNAMPFKTPEPTWSGKERDDTIRKASDAVWRTYVAVPWCIADLGSVAACERWGPEVLKRGDDMKDRENYLRDNMNADNAGRDAVNWRQGHTPSGRIGVLLAGVISAVIFAALVIVLAATTLASLLGALMLLVCGVVFACLWCIPGRCRQWGVSWFETLIGLTIVSFTSTMLLGAVMIINTALLSLLPVYGWLMVSMLNIAAAAMGFKLKGKLDGIVSAGGAQLAGRGVLNTVGHLAGRRTMAKALAGNPSGGNGGLIGWGRRQTWGLGGRWGSPGGTGSAGTGSAGGMGGAAAGAASAAGGGYTVTVTRAHNYPTPPSYPQVTAGTYGTYAATRPGLPGGPGGTSAPNRPGPGTGGGPGNGLPAQPALDPAGARTAKEDAARQKASTTTAPNGYPVRPGPPAATGVPHHPRADGAKTIQGEVVTNPVGAQFRTFPPPAAQQPASPPSRPAPPTPKGQAAGQVAKRSEAPPPPPPPS